MKAVQKSVFRYIRQFNLFEPSAQSLKNALEKQGFTLLEFSHVFNHPDIEKILTALNLKDYSLTAQAFTYVDENNRLLFILEELSEEEKKIILAHEQGHIFLGHLSSTGIYPADIVNEFEANEFSSFLLSQKFSKKITVFCMKHKLKLFLSACVFFLLACLVFPAVGYLRNNQPLQNQEFYITSTGCKYHKENCIYVKGKTNISKLSLKDLLEQGYEPCKICLP